MAPTANFDSTQFLASFCKVQVVQFVKFHVLSLNILGEFKFLLLLLQTTTGLLSPVWACT